MTVIIDPFVGTWTLNPGRSVFDPNHRPRQATMVLERIGAGRYRLLAEGVDEKGERCAEKPQEVIPDGAPYPVDGLPGLVTISTRPDAHTLHTEVRREDGSVAGGGTLNVSPDGRSMRAINFGFDSQLREFRQETMWDRS
jgi:hypothetical protein